MAIARSKDLRKLDAPELHKRLAELQLSIAKERANVAIGASTASPGKIREMRRTVARIQTILHAARGVPSK